MTLEDLTKIINEKFEFCKSRLGEKESLTDKYLALTGITQLVGGKTIEELFEDANEEEIEKISGHILWCIPGGTGMGPTNEDSLKPKSEVNTELSGAQGPQGNQGAQGPQSTEEQGVQGSQGTQEVGASEDNDSGDGPSLDEE